MNDSPAMKEIKSQFLAAAREGNTNELQKMLEVRKDLIEERDDDDEYGRVALIHACERGHLEVAKLLVRKGANIHSSKSINGSNALHWASQNGHVDVVKWLIGSGINVVEKSNNPNYNALHFACVHGHLEVARVLVENGVDIHAAGGKYAETALHIACSGNFVRVAKWLVDLGVDVASKDITGWTALTWALASDHLGIVKWLYYEQGAELEPKDLFLLACTRGNLDVVKWMIQAGRTVHWKDESQGATALHWVCAKGNLVLAKWLVQEKASIDVRTDKHGASVLHWACVDGQVRVAKWLIAIGANIAAVANDGSNALHYACAGNHVEVVKLLVDHDIALRIEPNNNGQHTGNDFALERLLLDTPNDANVTPIEFVRRKGHSEILQYMQLVCDLRAQLPLYSWLLRADASTINGSSSILLVPKLVHQLQNGGTKVEHVLSFLCLKKAVTESISH